MYAYCSSYLHSLKYLTFMCLVSHIYIYILVYIYIYVYIYISQTVRGARFGLIKRLYAYN